MNIEMTALNTFWYIIKSTFWYIINLTDWGENGTSGRPAQTDRSRSRIKTRVVWRRTRASDSAAAAGTGFFRQQHGSPHFSTNDAPTRQTDRQTAGGCQSFC